MNLFRLLKPLPKDRTYHWGCVLKKHSPTFKEVFKQLRLDHETPTLLYQLPKSAAVALQVSPPEGIELKKLRDEDISQAIKIYPFRSDYSMHLFKRRNKFNTSLGAYDKATGELLGWCLRYETGVLTAFQVEEKHKRKGYGELLLKAMSKMVGEQGDDVTGCIVEGNVPSLELFEKLGFKYTEIDIVWLGFEQKLNNDE